MGGGSGRSIIELPSALAMGRAAYLAVAEAHLRPHYNPARADPPPSARRPARVRARSRRGRQAAPRSPEALATKLARALQAPGVSRSSAVASSSRSGRVVYARNPSLPLIPASNEKLAVTYAALVVARAVLPDRDAGARARRAGRLRVARRPRAEGLRRPDPVLARRSAPRGARCARPGSASSAGGSSATSPSSTPSGRAPAGSRTSSSTSLPRSRRSPSTAGATSAAPRVRPRWPRRSLFRKALAEAGVRVVGPARAGAAPADAEAFPIASLLSPPARRASCASWTTRATTSRPRSCSSSSARSSRAGDDRGRGARSPPASWPSTASRSAASASPTARGCRASTG